MKNNTMAMLALITLVAAPASLVGYIDPKTCPIQAEDVFATCQQAADQHIWGFWIFALFGVGTFAISFIRRRLASRKRND